GHRIIHDRASITPLDPTGDVFGDAEAYIERDDGGGGNGLKFAVPDYCQLDSLGATQLDAVDISSILPYYQVHPGRNRFFCRGRCLMARNVYVFWLSLCLILTVSAFFFAFECRLLAQRLSPAIAIVAVIQFIFVLANFLRTALSDPGVLRRATPAEASYLEGKFGAYYPSIPWTILSPG
ncbi:unnamed protein product, partial [Protopolystoma xenopodis]